MNITQNSNALKFIAFFLVAVILLCLFGFTVDGWQLDKDSSDNEQTPSEENAEIVEDPETEPEKEPEVYIPEYVNPLTGLETDATSAAKRHLAFIMDSEAPLYGISYADILIEFPVEADSTRLACITNNYAGIGKIGSLTKTKDYISNIVTAFDSITVSNGKDAVISYETQKTPFDLLDLEYIQDSKYTEFNNYTYSNGNLISRGMELMGFSADYVKSNVLPYNFPDFGHDNTKGGAVFTTLQIAFSNKNFVSLQFDTDTRKYTYSKNGSPQLDLVNNKPLLFDNCFVLFADSVTYEDSSGAQMLLKTNGFGDGYFFTEGTAQEITWEYLSNGTLTFYDESGIKLTVNRGTSYISFVKSSQKDSITLS